MTIKQVLDFVEKNKIPNIHAHRKMILEKCNHKTILSYAKPEELENAVIKVMERLFAERRKANEKAT